jgi:hypothetical protein
MNTPKPSPYAILQRYADDLALMPLPPRTQNSYWACVRQLGARAWALLQSQDGYQLDPGPAAS